MKLFPIDTFVGENFLAGETLAGALPLIRPIDFNINSCLLYDSCIIPAVEERRKAASTKGISNFRSGGGRAGGLVQEGSQGLCWCSSFVFLQIYDLCSELAGACVITAYALIYTSLLII